MFIQFDVDQRGSSTDSVYLVADFSEGQGVRAVIFRRTRLGLLAALASFAATSAAQADAAAGKVLFVRQCALCHATKRGEVFAGPSLAGLLGRKAGSGSGFAFSAAMKAFGRKWDTTTLDAFLASPGKIVPRTTMAFAGQPDAAKRADIIAYLATLR